MGEYTHRCKPCQRYYASTHPDPEKATAYCPCCNSVMQLIVRPWELFKKEMNLHSSEIGVGQPYYKDLAE